MKAIFTLLFIQLFVFQQITAQNPVYLETFQRDYQSLSDPISLTDSMVWDDPDIILPVPLRSEFFDSDSNFYIYSFGLGAELFLLTDDSEFKGMIPLDYDLIDRGYLNDVSESDLSVAIDGEDGSRILKLEWNNVGFFDELDNTGMSESFVNFQVWVYESEPYIEYHYGPSNFAVPIEAFSSWSKIPLLTALITFLDLETEELGLFVLQGEPDNPELVYSDSGDLDETDITGLSAFPADGTVYRFTLSPSSVKQIWDRISDVKVVPSIVSDNIRFTAGSTDNIHKINYQIKDIKGNILISGQSETDGTIHVSQLTTGQYFISIQEENKWLKTLRFVKI
jgi:hypothetical protein